MKQFLRTTILNPLSSAWATFLVELCNTRNRQPTELESCPNHLQMQKGL